MSHDRNDSKSPLGGLPLPIRALNALLRGAGQVRSRPLFEPEPEALLEAARAQTGLTDFGPFPVREALCAICEGLREERGLTSFGRAMLGDDVVQKLAQLLRVLDHQRRHPEIEEETIERPIFIVGFYRTGTTFLYRLLASHPGLRAPLAWEMADPIPPPVGGDLSSARRIGKSTLWYTAASYLIPRQKVIYPYGPTLPEECNDLMAATLQSDTYTVLRGPYAEWLKGRPLGAVYRYHRSFLKMFQAARPGPRWVLKAPWHLRNLRWLIETYPDARILWTHRDPARSVPSAASMLLSMRTTLYRDPDPEEIGRGALSQILDWLEEAQKVRAEVEADPSSEVLFMDIHQRELERRGVEIAEEIFTRCEVPTSAYAMDRVKAFSEQNQKGSRGVHRYTAEDFGLTAEEIREATAAYIERYAIPT